MDPILNANALGIHGGALSRLQPGPIAQPAVNGQAFQMMMQGTSGSTPAPTQGLPTAQLLFNRMGQGVAMPPQGIQTPTISQFEARLSEARKELYAAELGPQAEKFASMGTIEGFLKFRGIQVEGPTLNFTNAEVVENHA